MLLIFVEISERSIATRLTEEAELETHRSHIVASSNSITKQKSKSSEVQMSLPLGVAIDAV